MRDKHGNVQLQTLPRTFTITHAQSFPFNGKLQTQPTQANSNRNLEYGCITNLQVEQKSWHREKEARKRRSSN